MKGETPMKLCVQTLALTVVFLSGCSSPSPVDEVIASNLEARGGQGKIEALNSIRETGTVTASGGRVARMVREIKRPGLFRLEFSYQGTKSVFAHDAVTGWQVAPLQGQLEPRKMAPEDDAAGGVDQRDIEGPLLNWREKGHTVELVGSEMLPGGEAFKLKVTLNGGAIRFDYVDVESRQVVRSDGTRIIQGRPTRVEMTFSDFREVDGLVFPHRVETRSQERPGVLTVAVEEVELNPDLDDQRFRFPG